MLAQHYKNQHLQIVLIEAPGIKALGVGEATVPAIVDIHQRLNIDEAAFIKATGATFKLGIEFRDWYQPNQHFFHPFSDFGIKVNNVDFHHCWLQLRRYGVQTPIQAYSLGSTLARAKKFALPDMASENPLAWYGYAYHFDAVKYAGFLKHYAQALGVEHCEAEVVKAEKNLQTGFLQALLLANGRRIGADFFLDCSGFGAVLLHGEYGVAYEDWSRWLPCNKAWVVQTQSQTQSQSHPRQAEASIPAYTVSQAMSAGWKWKIPLQNRCGNGYVYSDRFIDDQAAKTEFLNSLQDPRLGEPRLLSFGAGMRSHFWVKNCAALGLASGFIEPLESTSISLMHTGVEKIIAHLPGLQLYPEAIQRANTLNRLEYERIRDFIILHYWASQRSDSAFWKSFSAIELPSHLAEKIAAYLHDGRLLQHPCESFRAPSWMALYSGFNLIPKLHSVAAQSLGQQHLQHCCHRLQRAIQAAVQYAPSHREFLQGIT